MIADQSNGKLTVAVTGPTGEIGRAFIRALEGTVEVERIVGMARRPFDASREGWQKFEYRQGDILDRDSLRALVEEADVVAHLAFIIVGQKEEARRINVDGSRNVFDAALEAGVERLIYTSSVAAYGFHEDNPDVLTEDIPARGTDKHYYSAHKAEVETLLRDMAAGSETDVYIFRPCIVAGPTALALVKRIPYVRLNQRFPQAMQKLVDALPRVRPVIPDPGVPIQLVHEDDVASALTAATVGRGEPGVYNLAADGQITLSDLAHALGWYAIPLPDLAVELTAKIVSALPELPAEASWVHAIRTPVLMDCTRAKEKLGWQPRYDATQTLDETVRAAREKGLLASRDAST